MVTLLDCDTKFEIDSYYNIPNLLHKSLYFVWLYKYEELYENGEEADIGLENACEQILEFFDDELDQAKESHLSYIFMAIILAEAVKPTVKTYLPDETTTDEVYKWLDKYLENQIKFSEIPIEKIFPSISVGCQAIDEALDVFRNLIRVIEPLQAKEALLEILDDCLEGYAIFPGSEGRRDLFNWWLLEVVPAAWCLKLPQHIYTIKGLLPFNQELNP